MTGNITSSSKVKTGKNTVTEDVEYDVDELPGSDLSQANFVDLIETLGGGGG